MMKAMTALLACAAIAAGVAGPFVTRAGAEEYADITGLVYIRDEFIFEPAEGAGVTLYKRTDATPSGWLLFGDAETVDEDGYYRLNDIQITGSGGLCQYYDWFKIYITEIDIAEMCFERSAHKQPREGVVRVDVILYKYWNAQTPPPGEVVSFQQVGHFACFDEEGRVYLPTIWPGEEGPNEATCPPGENGIYFGG